MTLSLPLKAKKKQKLSKLQSF